MKRLLRILNFPSGWFEGSGSRCEPQGNEECECHKVPLHSEECWHGKASVLILATTIRSIMIDAHSSSNWSHLILQVLLEACVAFSQRSQSDPRQPLLSVVTLMNQRAFFAEHKKKISILVLAVAAECITSPVSIYSAWVMLGFGGCWALWETIQLFGRETGGVSRQGEIH